MDAVAAAEEAVAFVREHNLPLLKQAWQQYIVTNLALIDSIIRSGQAKLYPEYLQELRKNALGGTPRPLLNPYLRPAIRAGVLALSLGFGAYALYMRAVRRLLDARPGKGGAA
jgi:hypothetical protein